jgi:hypothetical protein
MRSAATTNIDVLMASPSMLLALSIVAANVIIAVAIAAIPAYARIVRASIMSLEQQSPETMMKYCGVPTIEEVRRYGSYSSDARLRRGVTAVIECMEEIPCNPCGAAAQDQTFKDGNSLNILITAKG